MFEKGEIITTTVAGFFAGGGGVAVVNYLLNARKTNAEAKKIDGETEANSVKIQIEMNQALIETLREVKNQYNEVSKELDKMKEKVSVLERENAVLKTQIGKCEHRLDNQ